MYSDMGSINISTIETGKIYSPRNWFMLQNLQFAHRNQKLSLVSFRDMQVPEQGLLSECLAPNLLEGNIIRKAANCNMVIIKPGGSENGWSWIDVDSFADPNEKKDAKILFDSHIPFAAGKYELQFELQLQDGNDQALTLEVMGKNGKEVLARKKAGPADFADGSLTVYLPFALEKDDNTLTIRAVSDNPGLSIRQIGLRGVRADEADK